MQAEIGTRLVIEGITRKGKNRTREHGTVWVVIQIAEWVLFARGMRGPWLFLEPMIESCKDKTMAARWIHGVHDDDFRIVREV